MSNAVYQNDYYRIVTTGKVSPEGVGYYNIINKSTGVIEAQASILPEAINLVDELELFFLEREHSAETEVIKGTSH